MHEFRLFAGIHGNLVPQPGILGQDFPSLFLGVDFTRLSQALEQIRERLFGHLLVVDILPVERFHAGFAQSESAGFMVGRHDDEGFVGVLSVELVICLFRG